MKYDSTIKTAHYTEIDSDQDYTNPMHSYLFLVGICGITGGIMGLLLGIAIGILI